MADCAVPPDTEAASASLELRAVPPAARQARAFTEGSLRLWGEGEEVVDAATLVVCELVTNAIRYGARLLGEPAERERHADPTITLSLALRPDALHIEVRDGSAVLPVRRAAGCDDDRGRGLAIIAALAESWTCGRERGGGKWVRATLSRRCAYAG
ncbi:ATP-binding protein [Streptomyces sp. NPDC052101]|uniref:ATP-binding protein n=1 Tax=Streptomyces sp. NPDC052101 TaxID=3155763 RepID=UPI00341C3F05